MDVSSNPGWMTCTMCGTHFPADESGACGSCPFQRGCTLVCCPACGYEMVDPSRSTLVRLFRRFLPATQSDLRDKPVQRSLPR